MIDQIVSPRRIVQFGLIGLALACWTLPASAQPPAGSQEKPPGPFYTLSGSVISQLDADLDTQGSFSVSSLLFRASVAQPVSRKTILGLSLSYDHLDFDFSEDAELESASPWDKVDGLNLALPVIRKVNDRWSLLTHNFDCEDRGVVLERCWPRPIIDHLQYLVQTGLERLRSQ